MDVNLQLPARLTRQWFITFRHIPGDGLPPGSLWHQLQLHLTDAVPGFHAGGLKHWSAPHWPSFTRTLLAESWRMRKSGTGVFHTPFLSVLTALAFIRCSELTVHCKHAIINYICPECVMVGFDITESCFMITAQHFSKEAELNVWTSANRLACFLCLGGQGLTNASSASLPLKLGLKLPTFYWKWKVVVPDILAGRRQC